MAALEGTLIACEIGTIRSLKDGSVSITLETPEISPGKVGELFGLKKKIAYCYISAYQVSLPERKIIDALEPEMVGKTPSLRLRNVLYVCWEQDPEGYADADSHYRAKMEAIITEYKNNLV